MEEKLIKQTEKPTRQGSITPQTFFCHSLGKETKDN